MPLPHRGRKPFGFGGVEQLGIEGVFSFIRLETIRPASRPKAKVVARKDFLLLVQKETGVDPKANNLQCYRAAWLKAGNKINIKRNNFG